MLHGQFADVSLIRQHIGLLKSAPTRDLIIGILLETYHFVRLSTRHIGAAINSAEDDFAAGLLSRYLTEEYSHYSLIATCLRKLGLAEEHIVTAHPLIGTASLVSMFSDVARSSTLGYLCCLNLIEMRSEDLAEAEDAWVDIARKANLPPDTFSGLLQHMQTDVNSGHSDLLETWLQEIRILPPRVHTRR
ncbi:hypothetical protein GCT19_39360 [Paraburkholderia sp. CNPSo 3155]|uniref:Uncharacterized protein n=2 Tax=Paraburkholderia atlantica TaxID=2654982 RepID=A0A6I1QB01_PARAM|nr:hypothetical protein [Paraburkholderia atlantica]MBB5429660.1 hypothetical protein [Paraburkholderia atlantica]MPW11468.1 hypothetical protein [Paraburkholderia atlantica]